MPAKKRLILNMPNRMGVAVNNKKKLEDTKT